MLSVITIIPKDRIWETTGEPPHVPASLSLCPPLSMSTDFLWVLASVWTSFVGRAPGLGDEKELVQTDNGGENLKSCTNILELSVCESK